MKITLGQYIPGNSLIHRLDPRLKIILSFVIMIVIFFFTKAASIGLYALFVLSLTLLAKIPLRILGKSLKAILFLATFAFIFNAFSGSGPILLQLGPLALRQDGLMMGLLMVLRLILLVTSTAVLLTHTTSVLVLAAAIEDVLKPLRKLGVNCHEIAMMISIALRFIPTIGNEAEQIMRAQSSRGANYDDGSLMHRAKGLVTIIVPLFVHAIKRAEELAIAMEARAYTGGEGRTRLRVIRSETKDYLFLLASVVVIAFCFVLQYYGG